VNQYWENKLKEEAYTKSTLKYVNIDNMEIRKAHMVMIISQVDSVRDRGTMMASHTAQEFQIPVLLSYFFFMENNKLLEVKFKVDLRPANRIPYQYQKP
jgi:hypothetical protein